MKALNKEKQLREILEEFQEIDIVYYRFEMELTQILDTTITEYYSDTILDKGVKNEYQHFARLIFNVAESVIDKDQSYPEYRLIEELEGFKRMSNQRDADDFQDSEFSYLLGKRLKDLTTEYFKNIYELSGNGFRLLELTMNHHILNFVNWLGMHLQPSV